MRLKSTLSALGIAATLIVGADYAAMAATGGSFILGNANVASTQTTLTRSTVGTTLALNAQPGSSPLTVNSGVKATNLNVDRLDGLDSTNFANRSRVMAFQPPGCQQLPTVTSTFQKIANLGTFTKAAAGTLAEINFSTTLFTASSTGTGTVFELRVDDRPTTLGKATALTRDPGKFITAHLQGVFPGLTAGTHTVSIWALSTNGNATQAMYDAGCFNSAGVNNVYVEEFN